MIDSQQLREICEVCRKYGVDVFKTESLTLQFSPLGMPDSMAESKSLLPDIQSYQSLREYDSLHGIPSINEEI